MMGFESIGGYGGEPCVVPSELLEALVGIDECSYDHNGDCQMHCHFGLLYGQKGCPHAVARQILAAVAQTDR